MLEKGSGEVLTAARAVALAACDVAASVPPASAAIRLQVALSPVQAPRAPAASAAPAGIRMKVCTVSHSESTTGILSATNSTSNIRKLAPSTSGFCSICRPAGSGTQPI